MPPGFKAIVRSAAVTARRDLDEGVSAGATGTIESILGLDRAVMVRFGSRLVRCTEADLQPSGPPARGRGRGRRAELTAA